MSSSKKNVKDITPAADEPAPPSELATIGIALVGTFVAA